MWRLILGLVLGLGSFIAVLVAPSSAYPCSMPQPGWLWVGVEDDVDEQIPADAALVFRARRSDIHRDIDVVMLDDDGDELAGELELLMLQPRTDWGWEKCPPESLMRDFLFVWVPEEGLDVGEEYVLEVSAEQGSSEDPDVLEYSVEFVAVEPEGGEFEKPEVVDVELGTESGNFGYECCDCDGCGGTCCEEDLHRHCWFVTEATQPVLKGSLGGNEDIADHQFLYRVLDGDGEVVNDFWRADSVERVVSVSEIGDGPHCFSVEAEYLPTGETKTSDEVCVEEPDGIDFGESDLDWTWPEDTCEEPPPDGGDDAGSGAWDVGVDESVDAGGGGADVGSGADDGDGDGGCSAAGGGAPVPVAVVLVMMGWWFVRRR